MKPTHLPTKEEGNTTPKLRLRSHLWSIFCSHTYILTRMGILLTFSWRSWRRRTAITMVICTEVNSGLMRYFNSLNRDYCVYLCRTKHVHSSYSHPQSCVWVIYGMSKKKFKKTQYFRTPLNNTKSKFITYSSTRAKKTEMQNNNSPSPSKDNR